MAESGLYEWARLFLAAGLLAAGWWVFRRVRAEYCRDGRLSPTVAVLQTGYFILYAMSSYAFLDSRLAYIAARGWLLALECGLMTAGLLLVLLSMPFLGERSFGREVGALRTSGIYRFSRNPQLLGGTLFVAGYALLWPSWSGLLWALLWLPGAGWMVAAEEEHLLKVFGAAYRDYCSSTSRWLGLPRGRTET